MLAATQAYTQKGDRYGVRFQEGMQGAVQARRQAEYRNRPAHELCRRARQGRPKYRRWRVSKRPAIALRHRLYHQDVKERFEEHRGYFDFVVPPLEGFWWQDSPSGGIDYVRKDDFNFISCIRLPDFVTLDDFDWAVAEATTKKKLDFSAVELLKVDEGLCVQCMHTGPYDSEPATVDAMHEYATEQGYVPDFSDTRLHHEIYLSDPRKCAPEKLKTVVRHPIKRAE